MKLKTLEGQELRDKTVLLRTDFNVPLKDGRVQDDTRLRESLATLKLLIEGGAKVVIASHLGRPKGQVAPEYSLAPVALALAALLQREVHIATDCVGPEVKARVAAMQSGDILLLENLRFHAEEEANDPQFAQALAAGFDLFVNDAFGTIHRAHASTVGVTHFLPSCAGLLVQKEVTILSGILEAPQKPLTLVVGGAKIDTKIGILEKFLGIADTFVIGGALANTFLAAQGKNVGSSLCEVDKIPVAQAFMKAADGARVLLPVDVVVAEDVAPGLPTVNVSVDAVPDAQKILDLGTETVARYVEALNGSKTVLWNGPMGLYENPSFENGTRSLAQAIADLDAVKVIGGGDSIDALHHFGIAEEKFTHISTGGGAMLEFLEGKMLPGVEVLLA